MMSDLTKSILESFRDKQALAVKQKGVVNEAETIEIRKGSVFPVLGPKTGGKATFTVKDIFVLHGTNSTVKVVYDYKLDGAQQKQEDMTLEQFVRTIKRGREQK